MFRTKYHTFLKIAVFSTHKILIYNTNKLSILYDNILFFKILL